MIKKAKKIINLYKGGIRMENVISLRNYSNNKDSQIRAYSILDLILDSKKKKQVDDYCNRTYEYIEKDDFSKKIFKKD